MGFLQKIKKCDDPDGVRIPARIVALVSER